MVWKDDTPKDANIIGERCFLSIKNKDLDKEVNKAKYIVQGHKDIEKGVLVHNSANVKMTSIRILLTLAAIFSLKIWSRDVSQAYLQSSENFYKTFT